MSGYTEKHMFKSNTHLHSPYSFSSFESIEQMVSLGSREGIDLLGINDFNTFEGYEEFDHACRQHRIYPVFNVEFRCFLENEMQKGNRWNDLFDHGVIYLCGKALNTPVNLSYDSISKMKATWKRSQDHIWKIIVKLNDYLSSVHLDLQLDYNRIRSSYSKSTVRERHVAKALYNEFSNRWKSDSDRQKAFCSLFDDTSFRSNIADSVMMQQQIIEKLLKWGKPAFLNYSTSDAFTPTDAAGIILEAGGIPCYPMLGDDKNGFTEMENSIGKLCTALAEMGIFAVEFISPRCSIEYMKKCLNLFREFDMCVFFGTEHNTPELFPLLPSARNGIPFDQELQKAAHDGACILAAHQELHWQTHTGFIDNSGVRTVSSAQLKDFIRMGEEFIQKRRSGKNAAAEISR